MKEHYPGGIAVYFTQLFQMSGLYLNIALFIWVGMLLKQSQLGIKLFAVFVPLRLPPELLGLLAVALMALPTAYTGASGIIIIAMGLRFIRNYVALAPAANWRSPSPQ